MARRQPLQRRKRRTREHVIADLSVNHVERQVLLCGFAVERVWKDYGIDLFVYTFDRRGEVENDSLRFQLKATDRLKLSTDGTRVLCRVERRDLNHWLEESMPVILVLYDARADVAYWLYLQAHFAAHPRFDLVSAAEYVTVAIPRDNLLNRAAMRRITGYKRAIVAQLKGSIHHAD